MTVDKQRFLELLNEDLSTEYQSIVQYVQHSATVKGPEYRSIVEELDNHLRQELQHALTLAQQIDFLGGTPTVTVPEVPDIADGAARVARRRRFGTAPTGAISATGRRRRRAGIA